MQVVGGATSSFWAVCFRFGFVVFVLQTLLGVYFVMFNLLYLLVGFLLFFLTRFVLAFFALKISLLHQFALARFRFSWHLYLFLPPPYLCTSVPHHKSLAYPTFLHMIPSDQHDIIAHLLFFCIVCMRHKIFPDHPFGNLFTLFLLPSLPMHQCTHMRIDLHPSESIRITFW